LESDALHGVTGVSVLSRYPDQQFYYRLSRVTSGPFTLAKRGAGALTCAGTNSTGVTPAAGAWLRFRMRVTRFDGRNRVRAMVWRDGAAMPSAWQADCWDDAPEAVATGRIGLVSSGDGGNLWDDLRVDSVTPDGAPPGYGTAPPPPPPVSNPPPVTPPPSPPPTVPPSGGGVTYSSGSELAHWWRPGWDAGDIGRDFASGGGVDAAANDAGVRANDVSRGGSTNAEIDLDGKTEALGNFTARPYGIGNSWSLAVWVRPGAMPTGKKPRYVFDLNGKRSTMSLSRIALTLDSGGHFAIEVSDSTGRVRSLVSSSAVSASQMPNAWYHVVAVKSESSSLALYVNGSRVAFSNIGVPAQGDVPRVLRIGARVMNSPGYFWKGGIGAVALWRSPLAPAEVTALWANGNRSGDLRPR
jgi:hypothetical protein